MIWRPRSMLRSRPIARSSTSPKWAGPRPPGTPDGATLLVHGSPGARRVEAEGDPARAEAMLGTLDSGMAPKLEACVRAIQGGVPQAHMIDGRREHSMLVEVFTTEDMGTMVLPDAGVPEPASNAPTSREGAATTSWQEGTASRAETGGRAQWTS